MYRMFGANALEEASGGYAPPELVVVHSGEEADSALLDAVQRLYTVEVLRLSDEPHRHGAPLALLFHVDLSDPGVVRRVRDHCGDDAGAAARVFVLDDGDRRSVVRAFSAGAQQVLFRPFAPEDIAKVLGPLIDGSVERSWNDLTEAQKSALKMSLKVFEDAHAAVASGKPISAQAFTETSASVIAAVSHHDFPMLLDALRAHHNYTFRHSMYVTGALVAFADLLGFNHEDKQMVATAGLVHDIGKLATPFAILNKPAKLDPDEWEIMRRHPAEGAAILTRGAGWSPAVIDVALHHHERLDGSGYPHRLSGPAVSDLLRMVSIADAFSALSDKRAYKAAMSGEEALATMRAMPGHFEPRLLDAFAPIALSVKR